MTDQNLDNIFGDTPGGEQAAAELETFLGGDAPATGVETAPAASYVTLQSTTGEQVQVTVGAEEQTEGMPGVPLHVVLARSGKQFGGNNTYYNGTIQITLNDLVVPGAVISVIGTMKGGARQ